MIEQRVLSGLADRLVSPEAVAGAARAYHQEMNRRTTSERMPTATRFLISNAPSRGS